MPVALRNGLGIKSLEERFGGSDDHAKGPSGLPHMREWFDMGEKNE